jgi:malonyl CoA-acyl carrier protein transacylase
MLSVNGSLLKDLQPHRDISKTNKYLPDNSQISVSLQYGPRNFIVTGPPRALYGFFANLRKFRALRPKQGRILQAKAGVQHAFPCRWRVIPQPVSPRCCGQGDLSGRQW